MKFEIGDRVRPTEYEGNAGVVYKVFENDGRQYVGYRCWDMSRHHVTAEQLQLDTVTDTPVILIDKIKRVLRSYPEIANAYDMIDDSDLPGIIDDLAEFAVVNERFEDADQR